MPQVLSVCRARLAAMRSGGRGVKRLTELELENAALERVLAHVALKKSRAKRSRIEHLDAGTPLGTRSSSSAGAGQRAVSCRVIGDVNWPAAQWLTGHRVRSGHGHLAPSHGFVLGYPPAGGRGITGCRNPYFTM